MRKISCFLSTCFLLLSAALSSDALGPKKSETPFTDEEKTIYNEVIQRHLELLKIYAPSLENTNLRIGNCLALHLTHATGM
jgi:hypothetical protein